VRVLTLVWHREAYPPAAARRFRGFLADRFADRGGGGLPAHLACPRGLAPADGKAADHRLDLGADLISFGRAFLADPDLVERLRAGLPIDPHDEATFYAGGEKGHPTHTSYRYRPGGEPGGVGRRPAAAPHPRAGPRARGVNDWGQWGVRTA